MQEKERDIDDRQNNVPQGVNSLEVSGKHEDTKKIGFKIVRNDEQRQSLKILVELKNIFSKQLPKMPKQYIVKLVFDRKHQCLAILKDQSKIIGGICFRVFEEERFTEIAFLAIVSNEQVRGYGTRLMNKLKQEMQGRKVQYLMTYADNLAIGYFCKQGFSQDSRMQPDRWKGYIKDYDGGTMMECHVHPTIDYSRVTDIIKMQKKYIASKIKEISLNEVKYSGDHLRTLAKGFTRINSDGEKQVYRIDPMTIPGVLDGGWSWDNHEELRKTKKISFNLQCQSILILLEKHPSIWPFIKPISKEDAPDYDTIIKEPIDLKTISNKLINNQYEETETFCEDILKMFKNSKVYNQPETIYYKYASQLQRYIIPYLNNLKDGSLEVNMPVSRKFTHAKQSTDKS